MADESIDEKRHEAIMRVTDFSGIKRDKDGNLENADALKEGIRKDWGAFKVTTKQRGEDVAHPRTDNGTPKPTVDEIMSIKDDAERQKAIAQNLDLFGG